MTRLRPGTRSLLAARAAAILCLLLGGAAPAGAQEPGAPAPPREPIRFRAVALVAEHLDGTSFRMPRAVHYDPVAGEIFVADSGNGLIGIFDGNGVPKFTFRPGGESVYPVAVATDADGEIYVLNSGESRISVFDYRGAPVREIPLGKVEGADVVPAGMGMDRDGLLRVLDNGGGRLLAYRTSGELAGSLHLRRGSRFQDPFDVDFDEEGRIYISDRRGTPVQVYDRSGAYLRGWGKRELGGENFSTPSGIAVDAVGRVYVADAARQDVKVFDGEGRLIGGMGGFGRGPGQVAYPTDVEVSPEGRVFVVERVGRRVQILEGLPSRGAGDRPSTAQRAAVERDPPG